MSWLTYNKLDISSYETFSTLIKAISSESGFHFPPLLIWPLGIRIQVFQLGILITFVNNLCFGNLCKEL